MSMIRLVSSGLIFTNTNGMNTLGGNLFTFPFSKAFAELAHILNQLKGDQWGYVVFAG